MSEESEVVSVAHSPKPPPVKGFNFDMGTGKMEFTSYPNGGMESMKENIGMDHPDNVTVLASGLCINMLLITKKCWGVIGLDLDDGPDGNAQRYRRELLEYDLSCDGDGIKPGMSNAEG